MKLQLIQYRPSNGLRALAALLSPDKSKVRIRSNSTGLSRIDTDILLNWGCANIKRDVKCKQLLNTPEAINVASNKLSAFRALDGINIPPVTTERSVAETWLAEGSRVVCRTLLRASGGAGIVLSSNVAELVPAPLYVKYLKKKKEFRAHVFNGVVIDVQEKRRKRGVDDRTPFIFNHANGYVFCRDNVDFPDIARSLAVDAVAKLGLYFGAVDIVWNEKSNQYTVLEVNCAPGLEGTTLQSYAEAIRKVVQ